MRHMENTGFKLNVCGGYEGSDTPDFSRPALILLLTTPDGKKYTRAYMAPERIDKLVAQLRRTQKMLWPGHEPDDGANPGTLDYDSTNSHEVN